MNPRLRPWLVPGLPFLTSLLLSASTVGDGVFWQDSGLFLLAVRNLDVLYPPGFVLYVILCKAWTLLFFFLDFTLAVHLFSSLCAALAAGTLAVACRDVLMAKGRLSPLSSPAPESQAGWIGAAVGCLAATGYTFWFSGIYAKGYALYYFILAQLLWRLVRSGREGDRVNPTWVAVLIGLSWAAHPSSTLLGPVFVVVALILGRDIGLRGLAWRSALAAVCAIVPSLFLPWMGAQQSMHALGDPRDPLEFLRYLLGARFLAQPGVFGWEGSRVSSFGQYLWEEMLGFGLLAIVVGLVTLVRAGRRLLIGTVLWVVPYGLVTIAFKIEGQHDCWFVAAWMPLYLAMAVGLHTALRRMTRYSGPVLALITGVSLAWAVSVNRPLLSQRGYDLPERFGRMHLEPLDAGAVLLVAGDDGVAICNYLQQIRKVRPDVVIVSSGQLRARSRSSGEWYLDRLLSAFPFLNRPDTAGLIRDYGENADLTYSVAAFLNANRNCGRPLFTNVAPAASVLHKDLTLVSAGILYRLVRRGEEREDVRYWRGGLSPAEIRARFRRERSQSVVYTEKDVIVGPQAYEKRLFDLALDSEARLARVYLKQGEFHSAVRLYEDVLEWDPVRRGDVQIHYGLGLAYYELGDLASSEKHLDWVLQRTWMPELSAGALLLLGKIHLKRGQVQEARQRWEAALNVKGVDPALRREIEAALRGP